MSASKKIAVDLVNDLWMKNVRNFRSVHMKVSLTLIKKNINEKLFELIFSWMLSLAHRLRNHTRKPVNYCWRHETIWMRSN